MRNDTFFVTMVVLTAVIIVTGFNLLIQDTMYANATIAPAGIPAVHQNIGIVPGEFTTLMDSIFGAIGGPRPAPSIGNIPGGVPGIPNIQNEHQSFQAFQEISSDLGLVLIITMVALRQEFQEIFLGHDRVR